MYKCMCTRRQDGKPPIQQLGKLMQSGMCVCDLYNVYTCMTFAGVLGGGGGGVRGGISPPEL